MVYPALLPLLLLMRTPWLPVINELTPRKFKWIRPFRWKTKSGFFACAITFQKCSKPSISVSTTATIIRILPSTNWVWPSLIGRLEFCMWKKQVCIHTCICLCVCVCVCVQTAVQPHWMAQCKMTNLNEEILMCSRNFNSLIQVKVHWIKGCDFEIHDFSYERPFWLCVPSATNIAMPLVWKNTNSVSSLLLWTEVTEVSYSSWIPWLES